MPHMQQAITRTSDELVHFDGLVQGCSNSSALVMKLLQSCTKPSICTYTCRQEWITKSQPWKLTPAIRANHAIYYTAWQSLWHESIYIKHLSVSVYYLFLYPRLLSLYVVNNKSIFYYDSPSGHILPFPDNLNDHHDTIARVLIWFICVSLPSPAK